MNAGTVLLIMYAPTLGINQQIFKYFQPLCANILRLVYCGRFFSVTDLTSRAWIENEVYTEELDETYYCKLNSGAGRASIDAQQ